MLLTVLHTACTRFKGVYMNEITLTLYNNSSGQNVVYKNKTQVGQSMTGQLIENVNMEHVVLHVPYFNGYASVNYAYIPEFKRYYYVSLEVMNGGRLKLTMKSDALSSFWDSFQYSQCIAKRSTSNYNTDIKDDVLAFKSKPKIIRRNLNTGFTPTSTGGCYILTIGGK